MTTTRTYTGLEVNLDPLDVTLVNVRDLAHHLALQPVYLSTRAPYSYAQRALLLAEHAGCWNGRHYMRYDAARFSLLFHALVAYYGPAGGPVADLVALLHHFGLQKELTPEVELSVRQSDQILLATERRDLLRVPPSTEGSIEPMRKLIGEPLTWRSAEENYQQAFSLLFGEN